MRVLVQLATVALFCLLACSAQAESKGQGFGPCREGFADGTQVQTEGRGEISIGQVQVDDRVWSFNQGVGKVGWSKVLRRVDEAKHYRLLVEFAEPNDEAAITKACWRIKR